MPRLVVSLVYLKYFETAHISIWKVYSCVSEFVTVHVLLNELYSYICVSEFVSAQELKHKFDSSYINV